MSLSGRARGSSEIVMSPKLEVGAFESGGLEELLSALGPMSFLQSVYSLYEYLRGRFTSQDRQTLM